MLNGWLEGLEPWTVLKLKLGGLYDMVGALMLRDTVTYRGVLVAPAPLIVMVAV